MKSLNFNKLNIQKEDVLSKSQMKKILGGHFSDGCVPGTCPQECFAGDLCDGGKLCYTYIEAGCQCGLCGVN